ncbi:MAG: 1-acyl-sn-glycerol-3-phosphate acyltransferase [Bacteroidetes bacterium]|nr:1-acyl-sn-glycerol-3-phosphate acyltransferase [Bacteroidota bacterium]MBS1940079.1 1-acyl-sn-glycerol-3-phosphate acyltransferase [Bacteroidota bacterium]
MYRALRFSVRAALKLYFGRIDADVRAVPGSGPLLLACNHPNSFLDALLVATHVPCRICFLARGDAFRNPLMARVLRMLYMIPVYRMSEGRAQLRQTTKSFHRAHKELLGGRSVLVFAEGLSVNEPGLRPLGKGTARIAALAWENGEDVAVVPVWLEYGKFHQPFAKVALRAGAVIRSGALPERPLAMFLRGFNTILRGRLVEAARFVPRDQAPAHGNALRRSLLAMPALAGLLLHAPWYFAVRLLAASFTHGTIFFDSVLFSLLFLSYPFWLLLLNVAGLLLGLHGWACLVWMAAPALLWLLNRWMRKP